jgi:hypothetical protein
MHTFKELLERVVKLQALHNQLREYNTDLVAMNRELLDTVEELRNKLKTIKSVMLHVAGLWWFVLAFQNSTHHLRGPFLVGSGVSVLFVFTPKPVVKVIKNTLMYVFFILICALYIIYGE